MKISWQIKTGGPVCRWSDPGKRIPYDPSSILEDSTEASGSFLPPVPYFVAHSLLGSGEWYVPWKMRWGVPRSSSM